MIVVVVATTNPGKLVELSALVPRHWTLKTLAEVGLDAPEETGQSFLENAMRKAEHATMSGFPAIADDSGLEVDGLDNAPGIHSARYAGPKATDTLNNRKLLRMLNETPDASRNARYKCAVAMALPGTHRAWAVGEVHGRIVDVPRGTNGFGYDPHFEICDREAPEVSGRTMAELSLDVKNALSHRARAYRRLMACIQAMPSGDELSKLFVDHFRSGNPLL
jgi:XTP/dITP diphosphohydrolase